MALVIFFAVKELLLLLQALCTKTLTITLVPLVGFTFGAVVRVPSWSVVPTDTAVSSTW